MYLYIVPNLQQNLQKEVHPGATPFSRVKGFRVFSIKPFPAEELPETPVKARGDAS